MALIVSIMVLLLFLLFAIYHWVYVKEVKRTEHQIGVHLGGVAQKLLAVNSFLIFSFTMVVVVLIFLDFFVGAFIR